MLFSGKEGYAVNGRSQRKQARLDLNTRLGRAEEGQGCRNEVGPVLLQKDVSRERIYCPLGRREQSHLGGKRTPTPSLFLQEAFEILSGSCHQGLTGDTLEAPQAETSQAVPILGLGKQWFDPDLALVHRLLIRGSLVVPFDPFEIVSVKRAVNVPTTFAGSTLRFAGARITRSCRRRVFDFLCLVLDPRWEERLSLRAKIPIMLGIIAKLRASIIGGHVIPIR